LCRLVRFSVPLPPDFCIRGCCGTIYQKVGTAFQDAARARGEILPAAVQSHIVLLFSPVSNDGKDNPAFFDEHVAYEAAKYNGKCAVNISRSFLLLDEPPLWHTRIPPELQFNDSKPVEQLDEVRRKLGLDLTCS
jgi:hypothetical protein